MSNIGLLAAVAKGLGHLSQSVVFVGGAVTELYATDRAATEVRATDDVDCVVELVSYKEFTVIEEELRKYLSNKSLTEGIFCALPYGSGSERIDRIKAIMEEISSLPTFTA